MKLEFEGWLRPVLELKAEKRVLLRPSGPTANLFRLHF